VLLSRPPLTPKGAFDLHVLGTPPAFILSQDQTLHRNCQAPFSLTGQMASPDDRSTDRHAPHHSSIVNVLRTSSLGVSTFTRARKDILSIRLSGCQDRFHPGRNPETILSGARPGWSGRAASSALSILLPVGRRRENVLDGDGLRWTVLARPDQDRQNRFIE